MSLINVSGLTFFYDGSYDYIFEGLSFQIDTDWRLGLIGRNGRGKTTLLKLFCGELEYSGKITKSVDFSYFPFKIDENLTAPEAAEKALFVFEDWELLRELSFLDIDAEVLYRPFSTLSKGEQTKVLLALLFLNDNGYFLIDEPTNHLDIKGRQVVSEYLNKKKNFILVSHDREFLDNCIDHVFSINKQNVEIISGNFTTWWENNQRQKNFELKENEKLKKDINRLEMASKKSANWSNIIEKSKYNTQDSEPVPDRGYIGHKSAKMMKSAKNLERRTNKALEEKSKLLKNIDFTESLKIHPLEYRKKVLLRFDKVSFSYKENEKVENMLFSNLSFSVENGDRIWLKGNNGSGKSTIIRLILGEERGFLGNIEKGEDLIISYVKQDFSGLSGYMSEFCQKNGIDESLFKSILRKLDFSRSQFDKSLGDLSMGQKKKVLIAKSLSEQAHLYIWDEPLNYIDILSRMQIEELLKTYNPTMIFVEHDISFSKGVATKTVEPNILLNY